MKILNLIIIYFLVIDESKKLKEEILFLFFAKTSNTAPAPFHLSAQLINILPVTYLISKSCQGNPTAWPAVSRSWCQLEQECWLWSWPSWPCWTMYEYIMHVLQVLSCTRLLCTVQYVYPHKWTRVTYFKLWNESTISIWVWENLWTYNICVWPGFCLC